MSCKQGKERDLVPLNIFSKLSIHRRSEQEGEVRGDDGLGAAEDQMSSRGIALGQSYRRCPNYEWKSVTTEFFEACSGELTAFFHETAGKSKLIFQNCLWESWSTTRSSVCLKRCQLLK